ncbi:MAG: hypothetical protein ACK2UH_02735 [Candidatus Promineifilaceae bacterium]
MTSSEPNQTTFHADQEHAGLRAVVLLLVLAWFVVGFLGFHFLLSRGDGLAASYAFPLSCVLGLSLALAISGLAEVLMKRHWPSGRRLVIDDQQLQAWLPGGEKVCLEWSGRVWALAWTFSLAGYPRGGRERRLTKKHHCLACQLQQDDQRLIVFGYLKGNEAAPLLDGEMFHQITPGDHYERSPLRRLRGGAERPQLPTSVLTGKDGRYWLAEQRRWNSGVELTPGDFVRFWETVKDRLEE